MLFSIINPSDPYTIEAPSLDVLAMVGILLGGGQYFFKPLDSDEGVPAFAFGGGDDWCQQHYNESLMELSNRVMDTKASDVADCLDSVLFGNQKERVEFLRLTEHLDREKFLAERMIRQDALRSSMNDIGVRAYRMASSIRKAFNEGMTTIQ